MKIDNFEHIDNWQGIKDSTMNTIGKDTGVYPKSDWKRRLIMSEHSPIRRLKFYWRWVDIKYWVSVHLVRHKIGMEHFVKTQRTDRTGIDRNELPQGALVNHACEADAQALINVSRKRLCFCASPETRQAWEAVKKSVAEVEPELASCMVKECVYRGFCPEMFPCGYSDTIQFQKELTEYRKGINKNGNTDEEVYKNQLRDAIRGLMINHDQIDVSKILLNELYGVSNIETDQSK